MKKSERPYLEPCPFCGCTELIIANLSSTVKCTRCGMACTMSTKHISAAGAKREGRLNMLAMCWNQRMKSE
ncbi:MAG: Lar family restriction alleviation protein [Clostridiales bacterium]|nr:Lar family restriction alleviation protein [Clostridiales bacterium]